MKAIALLPVALLVAACSTVVPYAPTAQLSENPRKIVERVLSEQPTLETPEFVRVNDDYFEYADGTVTEGSRWTRSQSTRTTTARVFYRSIADLKLYEKRGVWYVVPESRQGAEMTVVSVSNEADAKLFIDALASLRKQGSRE
ncbi:hypothetical protein [Variovorax saccharolyticus]|uniref:hypothetical protein n=1 Tax=Variovorax saccharolyticus TaxID=3053516 RepID=UPI0025790F2D|nr:MULTISPECIES: hypothetical protein [unclassified Variovorax]MDM0022698.1 hypothetical protein [Variovorax sp. J22R187]MDM0030370.1 hypothetical protein [Variovorax sp. J31P216]